MHGTASFHKRFFIMEKVCSDFSKKNIFHTIRNIRFFYCIELKKKEAF